MLYDAIVDFCTPVDSQSCNGSTLDSGSATYSNTISPTSIIQFSDSNQSSRANPSFYGAGGGTGSGYLKATAGFCSGGGPISPTVQTPDHLIVNTDTTSAYTCPIGTSRRRTVNYNVVNVSGAIITTAMSVLETVDPSTQSNCNGQTVTTSYQCTPTPSPGDYSDYLDPGCPTSSTLAKGCGYTFPSQVWEWCPAAASPVPIGDIGVDIVHNISITLDGNELGFTQGTTFPK